MARAHPKRGRHEHVERPKRWLIGHAYQQGVYSGLARVCSHKAGAIIKDSRGREYQVQPDGSIRRYGKKV